MISRRGREMGEQRSTDSVVCAGLRTPYIVPKNLVEKQDSLIDLLCFLGSCLNGLDYVKVLVL